MCDYSLQSVASRPAKVGDKLVVHNFGTGSRGFADASCPNEGAVCVKPGTEIAFHEDVKTYSTEPTSYRVAIFRQVNREQAYMHHDCLEFPDGTSRLLTFLCEGQKATVLQLPAEPKTEQEAKDQERVAIAA